MRRREAKAEQRRLAAANAPRKRPRIVAFELPDEFESQSSGPCALRLQGDNEAVVEWVSGSARGVDSRVQKRVGRMQLQLHRMLREGKIRTAGPGIDCMAHVVRERNKRADELASQALLA